MLTEENAQHDILLAIVAALFILFSAAIAVPPKTPLPPIIVPSG